MSKTDSFMLHPFAEGLAADQYIDSMVDIGDITIGAMLSDDCVLKDISIIRSVKAMNSVRLTIREAFEIKNQLVFLQEIQQGKLKLEGFAKRQEAFYNNESWFYREVERLIVYISRNTDIKKSQIQARLYLDYVGHKITEERFYECLDIVDQLLVGDIQHMVALYAYQKENRITTNNLNDGSVKIDFSFDIVKCNRLSSLGLLLRMQEFSFARTVKSEFIISELGSYFSRLVDGMTFNCY